MQLFSLNQISFLYFTRFFILRFLIVLYGCLWLPKSTSAVVKKCGDALIQPEVKSIDFNSLLKFDYRAGQYLLPKSASKNNDTLSEIDSLSKMIRQDNPLAKMFSAVAWSLVASEVRLENLDSAIYFSFENKDYLNLGSHGKSAEDRSNFKNEFLQQVEKSLMDGSIQPEDVLHFSNWLFTEVIERIRTETARRFYPIMSPVRGISFGYIFYHKRLDYYHEIHKKLTSYVDRSLNDFNINELDFQQLEQKAYWTRSAMNFGGVSLSGYPRDQLKNKLYGNAWTHLWPLGWRYPYLINSTTRNHTPSSAENTIETYLTSSQIKFDQILESEPTQEERQLIEYYVRKQHRYFLNLWTSEKELNYLPETHYEAAVTMMFLNHYRRLLNTLDVEFEE